MSTALISRLEEQGALLDEWIRTRRQIAALEAHASELLARRVTLMDADVAEAPMHRDAIWRSMIAEYSAAGRIAKGSLEHAFADAHLLSESFPTLKASFRAGEISAGHVREILRASSEVTRGVSDGALPADTLTLYEAGALEFAAREAPARTRAHVRELAAALAGLTIADRHRVAAAEREVNIRPIGDGLALLQAVLPEHLAVAIMDRLTRMARHQKQHPDHRTPTLPDDERDAESQGPDAEGDGRGARADDAGADANGAIFGADTFTRDPFPDEVDADAESAAYWEHIEKMIATGPQVTRIPADTRSLDQIRADLLTDLLLGASPTTVQGTGLENITAHLQVTVSRSTLTDADDLPALLDGHGPIHPDVARALASGATSWSRLFLDPTGLVTETDAYTPTAAMRRHLRARDQHCRFPGCRMPVHRCDTDHTFDHAKGGRTALNNLAHLCRTHHALKHPDVPDAHRWSARQLPDWTLEWTSPTGRIHQDRPPRRVMFVPVEPGPAGSDTPPPGKTARQMAPHDIDAPF
ncbi:DUF222 domain-containing protein [Microbacterium suwonense]|uniref:HNH endonuclease signature motif containing protein n=1 Tax=Microbacterium suwonense TaxID=683047 RepID=UPI0036191B29